MRRKHLFEFLLPPLVILGGIALLVAGWLGWNAVERTGRERLAAEWTEHLQDSAGQAAAMLAPGQPEALRCAALAARLAGLGALRTTLYGPGGAVLCDSARSGRAGTSPVDAADAPAPAPEVAAALAGGLGVAVRADGRGPASILYVALPLEAPPGWQGGGWGALRAALLPPDLQEQETRFLGQMAALAAVLLLLAIGFALLLARRLGQPITELEEAAKRFAGGDLALRVAPPEPEELGRLARALNEMAAGLGGRLSSVSRHSSDLEIVFSNMVEAVLAVDGQERLIDFNPSAARLFDLKEHEARGRYLVEAVRNADLIRFTSTVLAGSQSMEGEITLRRPGGDWFLNAQGNQLRDENQLVIGAIVVLHDVTRLRRLEAVRRDFVANVSHELKTPITSIKGFVETLQDGALQRKPEAERFLAIIARQAERLTAIIEDLLALSRIEQEGQRAAIPLEHGEVAPVLHAAIQVCAKKAREKNVRVELICPEPVAAPINPALLEQAVVNLLDNAIKASPAKAVVTLHGACSESELVIEVRDEGAGIAPVHLERLFERFYRVDPARSREEGGTGLGLAIVKHIAQAHRGRAGVQSTPGRGSTFSLHIPR